MSKIFGFLIVLVITLVFCISGCGEIDSYTIKDVKIAIDPNVLYMKKTIVMVFSEDGQATGFVIGKDVEHTYIITVAHGGNPIKAIGFKGNADIDLTLRSGPVRLEAIDQDLDIALVSINHNLSWLNTVKLNHTNYPHVGSKIYEAGFPRGSERFFSTGHISNYSVNENKQLEVWGDIASNEGDSGSPIFNDKYEVIGMTEKVFEGNYSQTVALSSVEIYNWLKSIKMDWVLNHE